MATLETSDANILDAETINWRLIVYPIVAATLLIAGGFGYYYYVQAQREQLENDARAALVKAQTPDELLKVADQFPKTDQATLALLKAAEGSFAKLDYAGATKAYQQVISADGTDPQLHVSAQLGLASTLEAEGKPDDAINAYLEVARLGSKSFYAPFAYNSVVRIYDKRGDKDNERKILTEMASLSSDSEFVKQAQYRLKALTPPPSMSVPVPATPPAPTAPAPAAPTAPAKP